MAPQLKDQDQGSAFCGARVPWALLIEVGCRMVGPDCAAAIEDLDAAWLREFPDPVDVFEEELAERLGLRRHPELSLDVWRAVRVRYIDAQTGVG